MLKRVAYIIVPALAVILAGCGTPGQEVGRSNSATPAASSIDDAPTALAADQQGGAVQTPDNPITSQPTSSADTSTSDSTPALPNQDQGITTGPSSGGASGSPGSGTAGPSGGGASGSPGSGTAGQPAGWQTYIDQQFGFTINYPQNYTTAVEPQLSQDIEPKPVHKVRFQEGSGDLALAQFEIEVFENGAGASLEEWLDAYGPEGSRTPSAVGNQSGYQITLSTEIAPNQFYYVAKGSYIYKLTPLGPNGQEMLNSFTLQ